MQIIKRYEIFIIYKPQNASLNKLFAHWKKKRMAEMTTKIE